MCIALSAPLHLILCVALAPLAGGIITRIKNAVRMRKGQGILQPYCDLLKLALKGEVIPETASWIFRAAPSVVLASALAACALAPVLFAAAAPAGMGDLLALVFILALGRFFLALAALDTGSAFGGMGSSREMFISSLAEPALVLAFFSLAFSRGSPDIGALSGSGGGAVSSLASGAALFLLTLAETSRVPVDNQETHLELTMVHEAMVLEYSGRSLALLELASYVKQLVFLSLVAWAVAPAVPCPLPGEGMAAARHLALIAALLPLIAFTEVAVAKMRLFRVPDFIWFAFTLSVVAAVCAMVGV